MIDTWSTVGSCAQVGKNCHISGGVGLGGVLEPLQANPVVIEDDCFIGARSEVAEGVIVGQGAVLSMGVFLGASTKIIDRETGEMFSGNVPPYSVVVPGTLPGRTCRMARRGRAWPAPSSSSAWMRRRAARPRSTSCSRGLMPLTLAQDLLRCHSVTPADGGAQAVLLAALERLGFTVTRLRFGEIENFFAERPGPGPNCASPGIRMWCRRARAGARSVRRHGRGGLLYGRGAVDMKSAIAAFVAAAAQCTGNLRSADHRR